MSTSSTVFAGVGIAFITVGFLAFRDKLLSHRARRKGTKITVIGDVFCDVLASGVAGLPQWGEDIVVDNLIVLRGGGSGLNTAIWLDSLSKRLQVRIPQVFSVQAKSDPELSAFTQAVWKTVHSSDLRTVPPMVAPADLAHPLNRRESYDDSLSREIEYDRLNWRTGVCLCVSGSADRAFVTYRGGNTHFRYSDFAMASLVPLGTQHVHIGGYYNCPGLWGEATIDFINECKKKSGVKTVSLNPQFSQEWQGDIQHVLPLVDFFICNEVEARGIAKENDLTDAILKLSNEFKCNCVIVTLGAEGALVMRRCVELRPIKVPAKDGLEKPLVDTVGAGDAFCAGFLHEVITNNLTPESPSILDAVRFGCACGTAALSVVGGTTFPGHATIRECLID